MEKKKRFAIIVLIIGVITLIAGLTFLLLKLLGSGSGMQDGEYLVEKKTWILDNTDSADSLSAEAVTNCVSNEAEMNCPPSSSVIWEFTEVGKGTLTTNNHLNDYDFIWALEDGKLKIETNWLYPLENEYEYELDQEAGKLKLTDSKGTYYFTTSENPASF